MMSLAVALGACGSLSADTGPTVVTDHLATVPTTVPTTPVPAEPASVSGETVTIVDPSKVAYVTVGLGGRVDFRVPAESGAHRPDGSPVTWPVPSSEDTTVLARTGAPDCNKETTCAAFTAVKTGETELQLTGPSGLICQAGDCIGVAAVLIHIPVEVTAAGAARFIAGSWSGPVAPCRSGSVSVSASPERYSSVCLRVGATLRLTFDDSAGLYGGVPAGWVDVPLVTDHSTVLRLISTSTTGNLRTAVFRAEAPGTTSVAAHFYVSCSAGNSTPCTIPPIGQIVVGVLVVPPT
jgi:hypothetical protein